ncbi:outer membrane lipoprotein carrier protein LolA [Candidatus Bipolaricaulota bacterium]|nr:outer membrane lipoprotein carrier protein LolA [Candidatus Bipolaricaulota bacterium]
MKNLGLFFAIGLVGIVLLATILQSGAPIYVSGDETPNANTNELLDKIHEKLQGVNSYRATFQMGFANGMQVVGEIAFVRPDQLNMEMVESGDDRTMQYLYSDGLTLWQYMPFYGLVSKVDLAALKEEFPVAAAKLIQKQTHVQWIFNGVDNDSIGYLGLEELDGENVLVFQATVPASGDNPNISLVKAWISPTDGLQRRVEYYSSDGKRSYYQSLTNVTVNIAIPEAEFQFQAPEGVTVMDATAEYRDTFQGIELEKPTY